MRIVTVFTLLVPLVIASGCDFGSSSAGSAGSASSTSTSIPDQSAALMQVSRDWSKAAAGQDVDRILSYWSDDAIVMQPDQPALVGKQAIRGMVEASMKTPKFSISWEPEQAWISKSGDVGYMIERNRVTFAGTGGQTRTVFGKALTIWKKDANGNWKCAVDTWNGNPTEKVLEKT